MPSAAHEIGFLATTKLGGHQLDAPMRRQRQHEVAWEEVSSIYWFYIKMAAEASAMAPRGPTAHVGRELPCDTRLSALVTVYRHSEPVTVQLQPACLCPTRGLFIDPCGREAVWLGQWEALGLGPTDPGSNPNCPRRGHGDTPQLSYSVPPCSF